MLAQISSFPSVSWLAIGPEIVLAVGAALVLLIDVQWKPAARVLGSTAGVVLAAAFGLCIAQWMRVNELMTPGLGREELIAGFLPFSQMIALDHTAVFGRFAILTVTALGVSSGWQLFEKLGRRRAEALALVFLAAAGFQLMAASTHLMMVFLGLEVGSIALYILAGLTRGRAESDEAAIKYFLLGSVASALFVYGVALVFASTGQLNILDASAFLRSTVVTRPAVLLIAVALIIVGLGFKVSAAPFHSWAPDVYQGAPAGMVGFMASVAKIGGFAALTRILFSAFDSLIGDWAPVVAGIATLSMVVGASLAIVQDDLRRLLAYSGVAHAGFILTGLVAGRIAAPAIWFYLAVYTIQLVGAFGVVSAVTGADDSRASISSFAGLARRSPTLALTFSILLLGMAGIPITSGFVAKFGVFQDAWRTGWEWLVIVAVLASVAALYIYIRVIVVMYMHEPESEETLKPRMGARWALGLTAAATILLGILPAPLLDLAGDAIPL